MVEIFFFLCTSHSWLDDKNAGADSKGRSSDFQKANADSDLMPGQNLSDILLPICFLCVFSWCLSCFNFFIFFYIIASVIQVPCECATVKSSHSGNSIQVTIATAKYSILYISEDPLARVRKTERAKIDSNGFFSVRGNKECCNSVVGDQKVQIWSDNWIWLHALISTGKKKQKQKNTHKHVTHVAFFKETWQDNMTWLPAVPWKMLFTICSILFRDVVVMQCSV